MNFKGFLAWLLSAALLYLPVASPASAQTPNTPIQHIILIIQENRTPDNLFHDDVPLINNNANVRPPNDQGACHAQAVTLTAWQLDACFNPHHGHKPWLQMYDAPQPGQPGLMDGACDIKVDYNSPCTKDNAPKCPDGRPCPQYTYVPNTEWDHVNHKRILDPYFFLANEYGFANYMFHSHQGPSFPAHQFLLGGTSAPISYNDPDQHYKWFAAENPSSPDGPAAGDNTGCNAPVSQFVRLIAADGSEPTDADCKANPHLAQCGYPCYDHPTLVDRFNAVNPKTTWKYYARDEGSLWTAPNAIENICVPGAIPGAGCTGPDWYANVVSVLPTQDDPEPILTALGANPDPNKHTCSLPAVSWVIPDGNWSDHANYVGQDGGPSWVAAIVNAVGGYKNDGTPLPNPCGYWNNTVILVTWDEWGGFYDHVSPDQPTGPGIGYPNRSGIYYVDGFRVPLLVISPYARAHYVSGPLNNHTCPNYYCHDFGSILNFIEYALGQDQHTLGQIGNANFPYADHWAPDIPPTCPTCTTTYSLADFFNFSQSPRVFTPIPGSKYSTDCFYTPSAVSLTTFRRTLTMTQSIVRIRKGQIREAQQVLDC